MDNLEQNAGTAIPGEGAPPSEEAGRAVDAGDTESRARAMGWVPQDEFRGPAEKWRSAEEFVARGENDLPILRERLRETTRKIADFEARQERERSEYKDTIRRLERMSQTALLRQREQLAASYDEAMRQAAANADVAQYDQLGRDKHAAVRQFDEGLAQVVAPPEPARNPDQPAAPTLPADMQATITAWAQRNDWFNRDTALRFVAVDESRRIEMEMPGLTMEQNLAETAKRVRARFPERFGVSRPSPAAYAVEGGAGVPASSGGARRGVADLPADARAAGERYVQDGSFKSLADYAKVYWES